MTQTACPPQRISTPTYNIKGRSCIVCIITIITTLTTTQYFFHTTPLKTKHTPRPIINLLNTESNQACYNVNTVIFTQHPPRPGNLFSNFFSTPLSSGSISAFQQVCPSTTAIKSKLQTAPCRRPPCSGPVGLENHPAFSVSYIVTQIESRCLNS